MMTFVKAFLLLAALMVAFVAVTFVWIGSRGISARAEPGRIETAIARTMRRFAIPRANRNAKNPVAVSPAIIAQGMAHFADHCAACHANDGSGETQIGLGLYPKPPDMRQAATQSLSDGELFYIIENGVRLTGMPAWGGGAAKTEDTWHLVHFIRTLPRLTPEQVKQMEALNPRPPARIQSSTPSTPHVH
jgi:mono/diheme cytochrome c family protein